MLYRAELQGMPGGFPRQDLNLRPPFGGALTRLRYRSEDRAGFEPTTSTRFEQDSRWALAIGRRRRIRTFDPLLPKQVRFQAALHADEMNRLVTGRPKERNPCHESEHLNWRPYGELNSDVRVDSAPLCR